MRRAAPGSRARGWLALAAAVAAALPAPASETGVIAPAELDLALARRAERAVRAHAAIGELLSRPELRQLAAVSGLDLRKAEAAIATLSREELAALAVASQRANAQLAGGQAPAVSGGGGVSLPLLYVLILAAIIVTIVLA